MDLKTVCRKVEQNTDEQVMIYNQEIINKELKNVYSLLPRSENQLSVELVEKDLLMEVYNKVVQLDNVPLQSVTQGIRSCDLIKVHRQVDSFSEKLSGDSELKEVYKKVSKSQNALSEESSQRVQQKDLQGILNLEKDKFKSQEIKKLDIEDNLCSNITKEFIDIRNGYLCIQLNGEKFPIANFMIQPNKILIKDDGVNKEIIYKFTCILNNNEEYKTICLHANELNNFEWVKKHLGIKYYIFEGDKSYKYLEIFIAELFKNIKEETEYTHVGWRFIKNKWVYLHGSGAIGLEDNTIKGSKDKVIEIYEDMDRFMALKESLTLLDISNDHSKTLPLFLFSHLSVIKELFVKAGIEPKFILWIFGRTGSMKTSVSKVFFNLFNRSGKEEISATFHDTSTAVELKSFEYKDCTMLIDDFFPTTSSKEKREMEKLASDVIRKFGDGISKSRSTKNLTKQKEFPPRGLCVITGEDKISGESTIARYIGIEVSPGDYISENLLYHQKKPLILSTHMNFFIKWVSKNFEILESVISKQFNILRSNNEKTFKHRRLGETFVIYTIVAEIFLLYCVEVGFVSFEQKEYQRKTWEEIIFKVIKTHEVSNMNQDPVIMYLMAIKELISSNKCKVINLNEKNFNKNKNIGFCDENKYYLYTQTTFSEVKDFWRHLGIEFPVSSDQINKVLEELGIIETKKEGDKKRRTLKISGKGNDRFLIINIEKMHQILSGID